MRAVVFAAPLVLLAGTARAERPPAFGALPASHLPEAPRVVDAPKSIAPDETAGIFDVHADPPSIPTVARTPRSAPAAAAGFQVASADRACLEPFAERTIGLGVAESPSASSFYTSDAAVFAVRAERLVREADGAARLEIADAWLDPRTGGSRLAATHVVPLARLATGPGEFAVWAFRDERRLEVVVPAEQTLAFTDASGDDGVASCGHARIAIEAATGGETASFFPMLEVGGETSLDRAAPARPQRSRALSAVVSISQLSRDPQPVLSVVLSWASSDTDAPVPVPAMPQPIEED